MAVTPTPFPGRYVVVKQFTVERPDDGGGGSDDGDNGGLYPLSNTAPLHYYNPFYLRLDLKTHSTRFLHNSIQQTSVDATPEHHAAVVSDLAAAGVLPDVAAVPTALTSQPLPMAADRRDDRRSCSIASVSKKTVVFAEKVDVFADKVGESDDDFGSSDDSGGGGDAVPPSCPPVTGHVFEVRSQTGEVVGDLLIERKRDLPRPLPSPSPPPSPPPSPVDDPAAADHYDGRRKRHEMFCRRRQSPVYSCDDGNSASSSSLYESCEDLPIVVLGAELGGGDRRPPLPPLYDRHHRRHPSTVAAINGYASCCPL